MPLSAKLVTSSVTAFVVGLITYVLVTFVPDFHHGIPPRLIALLPALAGIIVGAVAGWFKKETAGTGPFADLLKRLEAIEALVAHLLGSSGTAGLPPPFPAVPPHVEFPLV